MKTGILYVILTLIFILLGVEGYFLYNSYQNKNVVDNSSINDKDLDNDTDNDIDKSDDEQNNNEENNNLEENNEKTEDGVKLLNTTKENDKIVQEYEIVLNGKINILKLYFELEKNEYFYHITCVYNNVNFYDFGKYNPEFDEEATLSSDEAFQIDYIKNYFNEDNFIIIKGEDNKNYLAIYNYVSEAEVYGDTNLYIYNDNLDLLNQNEEILINNEGQLLSIDEEDCLNKNHCTYKSDVWYENKFKVRDEADQIRVKIENNQIYVLKALGNNDYICDGGILEERIYIIKDNKLSYEVINKYQVTGGAGSCY